MPHLHHQLAYHRSRHLRPAQVERGLSNLSRAEVPGAVIGQLVMEGLRSLDHVAYVRFASVYRNFTDLESFAKEVEALQREPDGNPSGALEAQLSLPMAGDGIKRKPARRTKKCE